MPVAASISIARLTEVFGKLGFYARSDDSYIFERPEDNLMFFPDVRNGRVVLIDIFGSITAWKVVEDLTERFWEALVEIGSLDE